MLEKETIIKGYNREKEILTNRLIKLTSNELGLNYSISCRLKQIDECIRNINLDEKLKTKKPQLTRDNI